MTTKEITQMSISQRITLVEDIWDSISADLESAKPKVEERAYVDARINEINNKGEGLVNWVVLKENTRNRKKC